MLECKSKLIFSKEISLANLPRIAQNAKRLCHQPLLLNKASNSQSICHAGVYLSSLENF